MTEAKAGKVCAVCGEALHQLMERGRSGKESWIHARELAGTVDHPAVPIDYDERNMVAKCDFCGGSMAMDERWYLDCADFEVLVIEGLRHNSRSGWSACSTCAVLVQAKDWNAIIVRHLDEVGHLYQPNVFAFLRDVMLPALMNAVEANTLAPIRPWQAGDEKYHREDTP